jgi:16S rRNA U516 pseudouridylate synthase RsuA-like enzyme
MTMISVINNVLAAIRKKVEQIILDGNIFVNKTSQHSKAEITFPSRGGDGRLPF